MKCSATSIEKAKHGDIVCDAGYHWRLTKNGLTALANSAGLIACPATLTYEQACYYTREGVKQHITETFNNFDADYNKFQKQHKAVKDFINNCFKTMIIKGSNGAGKTHLALAWLAEVSKITGRYHFEMAKWLEDLFRDVARGDDQAIDRLAMIRAQRFLVMDDLGKEQNYPTFAPSLLDFINTFEGKLLITTNDAMTKLEKRYGDYGPAIIVRLSSTKCQHISMIGKEW
jgi:DNA replication protein DnaC